MEDPMSAIERIMQAYARKRDLNPGQAAFVRAEFSKFIAELMAQPRRASMMFPELHQDAGSHVTRQRAIEGVGEAAPSTTGKPNWR
jgi:hypothetical protein